MGIGIKVEIEKREEDKYFHHDFNDTVYYQITDTSECSNDSFETKYVYGRITKKHHVKVIHQYGKSRIETNETMTICGQQLSRLAEILDGPDKSKWFDIYFKQALTDIGVFEEFK